MAFIMMIVNTETISGKNLQTLAVVQGSVVWSKNIGRDFMAGMKTLVGGEIKSYTQMLNEARNVALQRMVENAEKLGADAIICLRYSTSSIMQGAAEIMVFGTAVKYI